jgi:tight adherence protein B
MSAWVPAVLAFIAVAFGIVALALLVEGVRAGLGRRDLNRRLERALSELQEQTLAERDLVDTARRRATDSDALALRLPFMAGTLALLRQARLGWSPTTFILLVVGFAMAGGLFALAARLPLFIAILLALFVGGLPYLYASYRRRALLKKFEELLPEAIDYLSRAIRAGHPLTAGFQMIGEELADPLGEEFRLMFDQQRFGVPFEEALLGLCDRIELVDVRIFATSIIVQREVGGANFAEVLDNMAETVRARFAIRREIKVYTAQGRLSGLVVGTMPVLVGLGMYLQDPSYVRVLFEHPVGRVMAMAGVFLQIIGFLWIRRIVNVEI